ncbi:MAG: hypothetical protein ACM3Q4_05880 [Acidobacteriota bacterium]
MSYTLQHHHGELYWKAAAAGFMTLALLSFVSPQIGILGRGLRTTIPALIGAAIAITRLEPRAFSETIREHVITFILGVLFLAQAALRFTYERTYAANLWHTFFDGPLITLVVLWWILAFSRLGGRPVQWLRVAFLLTWCLSLALGVPTLLDRPGVARLTMGNIFAAENAAIWAPYGVGEYTIYTSLSVCFAPLLLLARHINGWLRIPALVLVFFAAVSVIMSTFTMAALMLVVSFIGTLLIWVADGRGIGRGARAMAVIVPLALIPMLYNEAGNYRQTKFITAKFERLYEGLTSAGLAKGDETKRGEWFVEEMEKFSQEPFLGYIPDVSGEPGHGHSSLSNSLVLFGLFGAGLWMAVLWRMFRYNWKNSTAALDRWGLAISFIVLMMAGILNPIWHSQATLCALFAMTVPPLEEEAEEAAEEEEEPYEAAINLN